MRRRRFNQAWPMLALMLAGCSSPGNTGTTTTTAPITPAGIADVQIWLQTFSQELPGFIADLASTNVLNGTSLTNAQIYLAKFQTVVTQILQLPTGTSPTTLLQSAESTLNTILGLIPASAPFVPLAMVLEAVISSFISQTPVVSPTTNAPIPVPAVPTTAALADLHMRTRAMRAR